MVFFTGYNKGNSTVNSTVYKVVFFTVYNKGNSTVNSTVYKVVFFTVYITGAKRVVTKTGSVMSGCSTSQSTKPVSVMSEWSIVLF